MSADDKFMRPDSFTAVAVFVQNKKLLMEKRRAVKNEKNSLRLYENSFNVSTARLSSNLIPLKRLSSL